MSPTLKIISARFSPMNCPGRRFERFGTCAGRYQHFDLEIVAHDFPHETAEREDRDIQCLFVRLLAGRAKRPLARNKYENEFFIHIVC